MHKKRLLAAPYSVWMVIFIVVPLLLVAYFAFFENGQLTFAFFKRFFDDPNKIYLPTLLRSLLLALECTALCLLIGYPVALFMADRKLNLPSMIMILLIIPMWINFLLRTYSWMILLENNGVINRTLQYVGLLQQGDHLKLIYTQGAVLVGMVYNYLPFMVLPIYSVLAKMDYCHIEAAQDLGANPFKVFCRVTLPLSVPGIITGITMVFMPAVSTFALSKLLGGGKFSLFGDLIESSFTSNNWGVGSAMSFIMMALILLSMAVMRAFDSSAYQKKG